MKEEDLKLLKLFEFEADPRYTDPEFRPEYINSDKSISLCYNYDENHWTGRVFRPDAYPSFSEFAGRDEDLAYIIGESYHMRGRLAQRHLMMRAW